MVPMTGSPPAAQRATRRTAPVAGERVPRWALLAHLASLVAILAFWSYLDRNLWFFGDEWDFIARRGLHHPQLNLWVPHNEHWSTLPILLWRALFSLFHLSTYWPYLIPVLLANVVIVHLIWRRCLRDGVPPLLAVVVAAAVGLLGSGWEDLAWAFQIGFLGSVLFGLLAIDLADRPDATFGRNATTSLLALAALMCSSIGDALLVGLAIVLLARRPLKEAVGVVALPGVCWVVWFWFYGREGLAVMHDTFGPKVIEGLPGYAWVQLENAFGVGVFPAGAVVTVVLVAWTVVHLRRLWRSHPATLGLLGAAVAFYVLAGLGRDRLGITPSRYVYIGLALLAPLVALALRSLLPTASPLAAGSPPGEEAPGQEAPGSEAPAPGQPVRLGRVQAEPGGQRPGRARSDRSRPWRVAGTAVAGVAIVAFVAANIGTGVVDVASRTATVRRDERQIRTTAELLAAGARGINRYPFPGSGAYAGYLTPTEVLDLYRKGVLRPEGPVSTRERNYDLAALDVATSNRPLVRGHLVVVASAEVTRRPAGPGCEQWVPDPARPLPPPALLLTVEGGGRSGAVRLEGAPGSTVAAGVERIAVSAHPAASVWAPRLRHGRPYVRLIMPPDGRTVLSDADGRDALLLVLPATTAVTVCRLHDRGKGRG